MNVIRPGKRDQQIDVQECNQTSLPVQRFLNQLDCDWGSIGSDIKDRKPRSRLRLATWRQTTAGEIRESFPYVQAFCRSDASRRLQHVIIDLQRRSHHDIFAS